MLATYFPGARPGTGYVSSDETSLSVMGIFSWLPVSLRTTVAVVFSPPVHEQIITSLVTSGCLHFRSLIVLVTSRPVIRGHVWRTLIWWHYLYGEKRLTGLFVVERSRRLRPDACDVISRSEAMDGVCFIRHEASECNGQLPRFAGLFEVDGRSCFFAAFP